MRKFLDSNIFLYAYLKPRRKLTKKEEKMKKLAKDIISAIEKGTRVIMTVVHLSEVLNIIENRLNLSHALKFLSSILSMDNVEILSVSIDDYKRALLIAEKLDVSPNDALAYIKMKETKIREIFTFDKHFRKFTDIIILPHSEEYETK